MCKGGEEYSVLISGKRQLLRNRLQKRRRPKAGRGANAVEGGTLRGSRVRDVRGEVSAKRRWSAASKMTKKTKKKKKKKKWLGSSRWL